MGGWSRTWVSSHSLKDATPVYEGGCMQSNTKTSWVIGTSAFLTVFGALCVFFDPMVAFALSMGVLATVKN